jgi:hypothetical protein
MVDNSDKKLGRLEAPKRFGVKALLPKFGHYTSQLPPPPVSQDWTGKIVDWGMMDNDKLGNCTCAAVGHTIQGWTLNIGKMITIATAVVDGLYAKSCGYVPGDPSTDQGGNEQDVLGYWQKNPVVGHTLDGWSPCKVDNQEQIKQAIWLTGGLYIAIQLPLTAQKQAVWDVVVGAKPWWKFWAKDPSEPGSWGGHAVRCMAYLENGRYKVITWGKVMEMTQAFWDKYVVEAYALLSKDWIDQANTSPSGFSFEALIADMPDL